MWGGVARCDGSGHQLDGPIGKDHRHDRHRTTAHHRPTTASAPRTSSAPCANREISSRELLEDYLSRVEDLNPALNAVVTLDVDAARAAARAADEATARGHDVGALHGLPITVKDAFETAGLRTTSGAPDLAGYVPARDADAVARLRAAGAVIFGKTNLPVFAMDWQSANPVFGVTNNPWDLSPDAGRIVRRRGGGRLRGPHRPRAGVGHPRIAAAAGAQLRRLRPQAQLRPRPGARSHPRPARHAQHSRPGRRRPDRPQRRRPRPRARRPGGAGRGDGDRVAAAAAGAPRTLAARLPDRRLARRPGVPGRRRRPRGADGGGGGAAPGGRARRRHRPAGRPRRGERRCSRRCSRPRSRRAPRTGTSSTSTASSCGRGGGSSSPATTPCSRPSHPSPPSTTTSPATSTAGRSRSTASSGPTPTSRPGPVSPVPSYLPAAAAPVGLTRDGLPVGMQVIAPYLEDRTAIDVARHLERLLGGYQQPVLDRT